MSVMVVDEDGLLAERGLLTVAEAAAAAGVSQSLVRWWINEGLVLVVRSGRRVLVGEQSLLDCELAMRRAPSGRPRRGAPRGRKDV